MKQERKKSCREGRGWEPLECELGLRVRPQVDGGRGGGGGGWASLSPDTDQSPAEGCPEQTLIPRPFQLCGPVGKVATEAKSDFRKRHPRCRVREAETQCSRRGWSTRKGV